VAFRLFLFVTPNYQHCRSIYHLMVAGILVNGIGLSHSQKTCSLAIYSCIAFYGLSKVSSYYCVGVIVPSFRPA
jgi:hypothetical protein